MNLPICLLTGYTEQATENCSHQIIWYTDYSVLN